MKQEPTEIIRSQKNQYIGPNAHLLSLQQNLSSDSNLWKRFHSLFISCLTNELNKQLPQGYIAVIEPAQPLPPTDIIRRNPTGFSSSHGSSTLHHPTWTIPIESPIR